MKNILSQIEGLKFPDEMVTRFFFKNQLHQRCGTVLELGCGNANNLSLFAAYGWECIGLDISSTLIDQGKYNFAIQGYSPARLEVLDLNEALPDFGPIDVLLMPSSIYYVHPIRAREIILQVGSTLQKNGFVFCRFRTPDDYRYGRGIKIGPDCFKLNIDETSEYGCVNTFYQVDAMLELLEPCQLAPDQIKIMNLSFDNLGLNGKMISNQEVIMWGRLSS